MVISLDKPGKAYPEEKERDEHSQTFVCYPELGTCRVKDGRRGQVRFENGLLRITNYSDTTRGELPCVHW